MPMLRLADYLREEFVLWELPGPDKLSFLRALAAEAAARVPAVEEQELLARLLEREEERSTGVGGGLALPHARLSGLETSVLFVGRACEGLDFAAPDGEPVDLLEMRPRCRRGVGRPPPPPGRCSVAIGLELGSHPGEE